MIHPAILEKAAAEKHLTWKLTVSCNQPMDWKRILFFKQPESLGKNTLEIDCFSLGLYIVAKS